MINKRGIGSFAAVDRNLKTKKVINGGYVYSFPALKNELLGKRGIPPTRKQFFFLLETDKKHEISHTRPLKDTKPKLS